MKKMIYIFAIIAALGLIWSFLIEPHRLRVKTLNLELEGSEDLKIVQLSDFHSKGFGHNEKKILTELEEIEPDYIFITGDFVDSTTRDLKDCQRFWEALVDRYPGKVFGVLGNHEYWHSQSERVLSLLKESGIKVLNNETRTLEFNGNAIELMGVGDPYSGHDDVERIFSRSNPETRTKILLAHSPEIFRKVKDRNLNLVLTGHTHGGQVDIPLLVRLVLPLKYDKKYKQGLFKESGTYLYVNRGVGTTILPARFNAPPEITLIRFE